MMCAMQICCTALTLLALNAEKGLSWQDMFQPSFAKLPVHKLVLENLHLGSQCAS